MLPITAVPPIETEVPVQIAVFEMIDADGNELTVTVTELEFTHPLEFVSVRVYDVVEVGLTDGLDDVELNPAGLLVHE